MCELCGLSRRRRTLPAVNTILPSDHAEQGFRLSCNGYPVSDELKIVFNVKHLPELDELRFLLGPFRRAQSW